MSRTHIEFDGRTLCPYCGMAHKNWRMYIYPSNGDVGHDMVDLTSWGCNVCGNNNQFDVTEMVKLMTQTARGFGLNEQTNEHNLRQTLNKVLTELNEKNAQKAIDSKPDADSSTIMMIRQHRRFRKTNTVGVQCENCKHIVCLDYKNEDTEPLCPVCGSEPQKTAKVVLQL